VRSVGFEQAAPATTDAIDLDVALRLAGADNPDINLAREAVREALAEQLAARALLLPSANVGGNYRLHQGTLLAAPGFIRDVNFQSLYLGAGAGVVGSGTAAAPGVRLFAHLGDAAYEPLAARQRVAVRRAESQATRNDILLDVATAYLELVGAEGRLEILRRGEADLGEVVRLTAVYAKAGQGRKADEDRARTNLDLLHRDLRRAEEEAGVASAQLCRLLNLDPSVRLRATGGEFRPLRLIPEDADVEGLVSAALAARPEVAARTAAVAEARTRVRQERVRPWLPTLSIGYSYGTFGGNRTDIDFGPLRGRSEFDALAVWNVQNLGFGNRARTRAADAGVGAAAAEYAAAVNRVRGEVAEAAASARAAAAQIATARVALGEAEDEFGLEMERIRQGAGRGRPLEVLDSFRQLLESRLELLRAMLAYNVAQFRLLVAVGHNPSEGPPTSPGPRP
jgi:outer membrane protein TolC